MKIVVGSTNPVKVESVREVFQTYFPGCEVVGVEVQSGVSAQPMGEDETIRGAKNRAKAALGTAADVDFGVGIEGGYCEKDDRPMESAWIAVQAKNGEVGFGGGLYFELPQKIAKRIQAGEELGPIMDDLTKMTNVKQGVGAIGILTHGQLSRKQAYEHLVYQALVNFVSPEWFN